jgi:hypothetical protein
MSRIDVAYGWPRLSFRGGFTETFTPPMPTIAHDVTRRLDDMEITVVRAGAPVRIAEPRPTPIVPIVPGVLANTAFYSSAWFTLIWGAGVLRRRNRWRRGRCTACGYDRRGIGAAAACPECNSPAVVIQ